jgi:hypothetical protein
VHKPATGNTHPPPVLSTSRLRKHWPGIIVIFVQPEDIPVSVKLK